MLVGILIIILSLTTWYTRKQIILYREIDVQYSRMENHIIQNNIEIDETLKRFLLIHKNLVINKGFIDYEIIRGFDAIQTREQKQQIERLWLLISNLDFKLKTISNSFNYAVKNLAKHRVLINPRCWFIKTEFNVVKSLALTDAALTNTIKLLK